MDHEGTLVTTRHFFAMSACGKNQQWSADATSKTGKYREKEDDVHYLTRD